jgi:hypothetical protein
MKKGKFVFGLAFTALMAVLLSGCISMPRNVMIDSELPKEQTALVSIDNEIQVVEFNGINIRDAWYGGDKWYHINAVIPAGETRLLFNLGSSFMRGNVSYTIRRNDLQLVYNFEAGKEYTFAVYYSENIGTLFNPRNKVFLAIWDGVLPPAKFYSNAERILRSWEIGEF